MSSTADVVRDLASLVRELGALLETKTAREIPAIARDLGAEAQLGQGVDALASVLGQVRHGVVPLRRMAIGADALVAALGCVPPLVGGLARATDASGEWLATLGLGLGDAAGAAQAVSGPIRQVSDVLDIGEDVAEGAVSLLAAGQWRGLITALDRLDTSLKALKAPPPTPPGAPAGALSGG